MHGATLKIMKPRSVLHKKFCEVSLGSWRIVELLSVSFVLLKVQDYPELKRQTASVVSVFE